MTGGTDRVRYALIAGYVGGSGFEDVTYTPQLHRLTLRGNLDFNVTDFLTISADVAGRMEMRKWGQLTVVRYLRPCLRIVRMNTR